jgi:hypothetical protein
MGGSARAGMGGWCSVSLASWWGRIGVAGQSWMVASMTSRRAGQVWGAGTWPYGFISFPSVMFGAIRSQVGGPLDDQPRGRGSWFLPFDATSYYPLNRTFIVPEPWVDGQVRGPGGGQARARGAGRRGARGDGRAAAVRSRGGPERVR